MSEERTCFICLDSEGDAIQGGCACRGSAGLAHAECRLRLAESKTVLERHSTKVATEWWKCSTCTAHFTGETKQYLSWMLTAHSKRAHQGAPLLARPMGRIFVRSAASASKRTYFARAVISAIAASASRTGHGVRIAGVKGVP
jgi:hypothetical protein